MALIVYMLIQIEFTIESGDVLESLLARGVVRASISSIGTCLEELESKSELVMTFDLVQQLRSLTLTSKYTIIILLTSLMVKKFFRK